MAVDVGTIRASLTLNANRFTSELRNVSRAMQQAFGSSTQSNINGTSNAVNNLTSHLKSVERIVSGILISQSFYQMANQIENAAASMLGFMNNMEKAQIAMEYFVGSAAEASGFIANMKDFAAETAFSTEQALVLSRKLMAAQFEPAKVRSMMEILNDASAASGGTAEQMDRIVLALTQMRTNGKIAGQELRQFAEAGIPIYQILKEELGLTSDELMRIGDLKISGDLGVQAVLSGLEKRYKGAAERIANTVPGMWETIKDDMLIIGNDLFAYPYKVMEMGLRKLRDSLEYARDLITEGGFGALFERMFTKETQASLRAIAGGMQSLGITMLFLAKSTIPVITYAFSKLSAALAVIIPVVAAVVRTISVIAVSALQSIPGLKQLIVAIGGLTVATIAAKALMLLWRVTGLGLIANMAAIAVRNLAWAVTLLSKALMKNKIFLAVAVFVAAVTWMVSQTELGKKAIASFVQMIQKLAGFSAGDLFKPEDTGIVEEMNKYNESAINVGENLKDMADASKKAGEEAKKAGKKVKDTFVASFDELYQIPDALGDTGDSLDDLAPDGFEGLDLSGMDFKMPDIPDFKWPELIDMPDIDWPEVPPWLIRLTKPIDVKINWPKWPKFPEFPKLPPPPPAIVTAWEWSMNSIRSFLTGFSFDLKRLVDLMPNLVPQMSPVPLLQPVLKGIGDFANNLGGVFDALKERLQNQWGAAWQGLGTAWQTGTAGVLAGVGGFVSELVNQWRVGWQVFPQVVGEVFTTVASSIGTAVVTWVAGLGVGLMSMLEKAKSFGTALAPVWSTIWEATKTTFSNVMTAIGDAMSTALAWLAQLWEDHKWKILGIVGVIVAGIIAFFLGVPGAVVAAIGTLIARVGPAFARMGPAILGAIKGIPNIFRNIMSMIPPEAQQAIEDTNKWFKDLPGKIMEYIRSIPDKFNEIFVKVMADVAIFMGKVLIFFTNLPGQIMTAIQSIPGNTATMLANLPVAVTNTLNSIVTFFTGLPARIVAALQSIPGNTTTMLANLPVAVTNTLNSIVTFFATLPGRVVTAIQAIPGNTANMLSQLPPKVTQVIETIMNFFRQVPSKVVSAISALPSSFNGVIARLPGLASTIISNIVSAFASLPGKIVSSISSIPSQVASIFAKIKVPSFSTVANGVKATFSAIGNIAGFAEGGIIGKDSIVRVGEGGRREAIIPLQNSSAMQPYVDAVVAGVVKANAGGNTQQAPAQQDSRPQVYVHTMIADKRGLKELERELHIIRQTEGMRGAQR